MIKTQIKVSVGMKDWTPLFLQHLLKIYLSALETECDDSSIILLKIPQALQSFIKTLVLIFFL